MTEHMYENTQTWNPFKGCLFNCLYCKPSFQAQAKRQKHKCTQCYNYVPHTHEDRLGKIPSEKMYLFVEIRIFHSAIRILQEG